MSQIRCQVLECFKCSDFPREEGSLDEPLGACPGWDHAGLQRLSLEKGAGSLYDGCLTIRLRPSRRIVAQSAANFETCSSANFNTTVFEVFGMEADVTCCLGSRCNGPQPWERPTRRDEFYRRYFQSQSDFEVIERVLIGPESFEDKITTTESFEDETTTTESSSSASCFLTPELPTLILIRMIIINFIA